MYLIFYIAASVYRTYPPKKFTQYKGRIEYKAKSTLTINAQPTIFTSHLNYLLYITLMFNMPSPFTDHIVHAALY